MSSILLAGTWLLLTALARICTLDRVLRIPVCHDISWEAQLVFENGLQRVLILACPGGVELVVRAHDGGDIGVHRVGKGPGIKLMEGTVISIARYDFSAELLLVEDVMLGRGLHTRRLNRADSLGHGQAGEIRIGTEAFPVATALWCLSKWSSYWAQRYMNTGTSKLLANKLPALPDQIEIPR
ncbi:hypothetical protein Trco_003334 [Trichoderma cornu-damae]|uniref:Secreted protein n=1 Tax=Trichoderma cornu-damae TaxID=654480 RepID=A0A9P8QKV6_9HYPO|nr:hypothetical protein Trco_003334 [Trichoderma cornu-damae]